MPSPLTMKNTSPQVDAYIAAAAPFAQPILKKLRLLFHQACPQIEETLKWGAPHFLKNGIVGGMAAFKAHAYFGLWKANLLRDPHGLFRRSSKSFLNGARLTHASQLPPDKILREYIQWITEAKQETTRARRIASALEWLAQGKQRNWKYQ